MCHRNLKENHSESDASIWNRRKEEEGVSLIFATRSRGIKSIFRSSFVGSCAAIIDTLRERCKPLCLQGKVGVTQGCIKSCCAARNRDDISRE